MLAACCLNVHFFVYQQLIGNPRTLTPAMFVDCYFRQSPLLMRAPNSPNSGPVQYYYCTR